MTRAALDYRERRTLQRHFDGIDPETPIAGWYRHKLRSGGVPVAVQIWFGAPHDPETGEEMDRSHRWQARVNGTYVELDEVWPVCAGSPIDQAEADHLMNLQRWGAEHGFAALADPKKRLDPLDAPLPF